MFTRPGRFFLRSINSPLCLPIGDVWRIYNNVNHSINNAAKNMDDEFEKIIDGQVVYRIQNDLQNEEEEPDNEIQDNLSYMIISVDNETELNPSNEEELTGATLKEADENEIL